MGWMGLMPSSPATAWLPCLCRRVRENAMGAAPSTAEEGTRRRDRSRGVTTAPTKNPDSSQDPIHPIHPIHPGPIPDQGGHEETGMDRINRMGIPEKGRCGRAPASKSHPSYPSRSDLPVQKKSGPRISRGPLLEEALDLSSPGSWTRLRGPASSPCPRGSSPSGRLRRVLRSAGAHPPPAALRGSSGPAACR